MLSLGSAAWLRGCLLSCSVQVELDNALSKAYTKVELICLDRKGLLFDIMRTLKDIGIRVAYGAPWHTPVLQQCA